jgi:hypothetical protein
VKCCEYCGEEMPESVCQWCAEHRKCELDWCDGDDDGVAEQQRLPNADDGVLMTVGPICKKEWLRRHEAFLTEDGRGDYMRDQMKDDPGDRQNGRG